MRVMRANLDGSQLVSAKQARSSISHQHVLAGDAGASAADVTRAQTPLTSVISLAVPKVEEC
jgi:hypothetical protein